MLELLLQGVFSETFIAACAEGEKLSIAQFRKSVKRLLFASQGRTKPKHATCVVLICLPQRGRPFSNFAGTAVSA